MFGASIGRGAMRIINSMVRGLASAGVHPNILTAIGVCINVGCGVLFGFGEFFWAGIVLIVANLFDMLDGNVARAVGGKRRVSAAFSIRRSTGSLIWFLFWE